jgi:hypothetical protein
MCSRRSAARGPREQARRALAVPQQEARAPALPLVVLVEALLAEAFPEAAARRAAAAGPAEGKRVRCST